MKIGGHRNGFGVVIKLLVLEGTAKTKSGTIRDFCVVRFRYILL